MLQMTRRKDIPIHAWGISSRAISYYAQGSRRCLALFGSALLLGNFGLGNGADQVDGNLAAPFDSLV